MPSNLHRIFRSAKVLLLAAGVAAIAGRAPLLGDPPAPSTRSTVNPDSFTGKDRGEGVTVPESEDAMSKFALAQRMMRLKDWPKAADAFQDILGARFRGRVVPARVDADGYISLYTSVAVAAEDELAGWPRQGLNVYRARFEAPAAALLEQAAPGDIAALGNVYSLYFVTDSGKQAGLRLMDLYLEDGQFLAAAGTGQRLLALHPNLQVERPALLYRTAIAFHLMGNSAAAGRLYEELKANHAEALGTVAGKEVVLADALGKQLQEKVQAPAAGAPDSWPTFGGNNERNQIPDVGGRVGGKVWSLALRDPLQNLPPGYANNPNIRESLRAAQAGGRRTFVMPVTDRGELYFSDGRRLYARALDTGVPLAGWAATYGGDGAYSLSANDANIDYEIQMMQGQAFMARQYTITLTDHAVLAVMGSPDPTNLRNMMNGMGGPANPPSGRGTRLVCLDRETGRLRWALSASQIPEELTKGTDQAGVRWMNLSGAPLVVGNNVYVLGRGSSPGQQDECYAICFDLESGRYRWSTFIGAGSAIGSNPNSGAFSGDAISHLAYSSGRLYVQSNIGVVAAIDAYNGGIAWLAPYPRNVVAVRDGQPAAIRPRRLTGSPEPWTFSAPILQDGRLFALPSDGRYLMVYDAATGQEIKRLRLDHLGGADTLLAVMGERVLVAGRNDNPRPAGTITCANWNRYDENGWDAEEKATQQGKSAANPMLLWRRSLAWQNDAGESTGIRGRSFVTRNLLFTPTGKNLSICSIGPGAEVKVVQTYPDQLSWPAGEGPGNVLVAQEYVVVATDKAINVYTDLGAIRRKYENLLAQDASSIENWLKYSEILFNSGELTDALAKLNKAIDLLGGINAMRSGQQRNQVFADALSFAQKLQADLKSKPPAKEIAELYRCAAAAAAAPGQQVSYRQSWALFARATADDALAMKLYQEILSQKELREVPLAAKDGEPPRLAAEMAEEYVSQLINARGPAIYAPYEKAAGALLESIRSKEDPAQLYAVAQSYPNSYAAPQALMLAAERFEKASDLRQAAQVLRSLLRRYNAPGRNRLAEDQRARLIESVARVYLKLGNPKAAFARLDRNLSLMGATPLSLPLVLADGSDLRMADGSQPKTFKDAAAALDQMTRQLDMQSLPDLHLPSRPPSSLTAAATAARNAVLPPWLASACASAGQDDLRPFRPEIVIPGIASLILPPRETLDAARYDRIVAWSDGKILCFEPGQTKPRWEKIHLTDPPKGLAWAGSKLLLWSGGEVALLDDANGGQLVWKDSLKDIKPVEIVATGGAETPARAVAPDEGGDEVRVLIDEGIIIQPQGRVIRAGRLGGIQGARMMAAPLPAPGGAEQIDLVRPLTDRVLLSTTQGRLLCLKLADGKEAWKTRLAQNQLVRIVANDDFAVVCVNDQGIAQLVALDSFDGQQVYRRSFNPNQGIIPQTFALAPDGTLVWMTSQGLTAKDLYDPSPTKTLWNAGGQQSYQAQGNPDQLLLIAGREVLAVANMGNMIERHDLRTGEMPKDPKDASPIILGGGPNNGNPASSVVAMRLSGPMLFYATSSKLVAKNLQEPMDTYVASPPGEPANTVDVLLGRDHVVVMDSQVNNGVADATTYQLRAYWRKPIPKGESGRLGESGKLDFAPQIRNPSRIVSWQPVEGGLYYLSGDNKLHVLMGARD